MNIKGKSNIEKVDVKMYQGIADLADNKMKKLDEELIPTFIIEEALNYYCDQQKYEICHKIKKFFEVHKNYIIETSRAEWFGFTFSIKQKA
jgi:hypothetical protein